MPVSYLHSLDIQTLQLLSEMRNNGHESVGFERIMRELDMEVGRTADTLGKLESSGYVAQYGNVYQITQDGLKRAKEGGK
jgi:hypothetical protein